MKIAEVAPGNWGVWAKSSSPFCVGSMNRLKVDSHARLVAPCWNLSRT